MSDMTHLDELEAEAIYIMREVAAECEKPVMLYSIGKDSSVMLHLALKAFYPEKPPFPFLHVNTTWKFKEMIEFRDKVAEKYGRKIRNPYDLEPEEEALIGQYFKEEYGADFVFVTHYPSKKRPFYAMDDPEDPRYTLSFDLLFKGLEITTGGQRIHDYNALEKKIADRGMTDEGMEQYMDAFKYGMPPHGGLGIGMERLTMQLLGEENVREACLFPRDLNRLEP